MIVHGIAIFSVFVKCCSTVVQWCGCCFVTGAARWAEVMAVRRSARQMTHWLHLYPASVLLQVGLFVTHYFCPFLQVCFKCPVFGLFSNFSSDRWITDEFVSIYIISRNRSCSASDFAYPHTFLVAWSVVSVCYSRTPCSNHWTDFHAIRQVGLHLCAHAVQWHSTLDGIPDL